MNWNYTLAAASVIALAGATLLTGCEGDESAPTRPRTQNVLAPDAKAKDNAFNRETETPKRDLPTSGAEFPGQSRATPAPFPGEPTVITAASAGASGGASGATGGSAAGAGGSPNANSANVSGALAGANGIASPGSAANPSARANLNPFPYGSFQSPESTYSNMNYGLTGNLPSLPANPSSTPAAGSTAVPNIGLTLGNSWGEVLPLDNAAHRAWPEMSTSYVAADVKHNPVYYFNIQDHLPALANNSGWVGSWTSNALEVPWFYANTAALPLLMVLEPPFAQRTTDRLGNDPLYFGYLPKGGDIIPSPTPGTIKWDYPFLKQSEENPNSDQISTQPATTQTQGIAPVAPTLDTPATTAPLSH
jgi:hypothetical protein